MCESQRANLTGFVVKGRLSGRSAHAAPRAGRGFTELVRKDCLAAPA